jgi:hypothetical protein
MLYIRRAGSMTGILTRTHGTGPDTSTVQFRPSCKCVINFFINIFHPAQTPQVYPGYPWGIWESTHERVSRRNIV